VDLEERVPGDAERVALQGGYGALGAFRFFSLPCSSGYLCCFLDVFEGFGSAAGCGFPGLLFCLFFGALFCDGSRSSFVSALVGPREFGWCIGFCD
jgi:hypothetical protein